MHRPVIPKMLLVDLVLVVMPVLAIILAVANTSTSQYEFSPFFCCSLPVWFGVLAQTMALFRFPGAASIAGVLWTLIAIASAVIGTLVLILVLTLGADELATSLGVLMLALAVYAFFAAHRNFNWATTLRQPPPNHLCQACGYDLRATPTRCPECGKVVGT